MTTGSTAARGIRLLRPLAGQDGIALVMALGILLVLGITAAALMRYTGQGSRSAVYGSANQRAFALAEAGLNEALAVIGNPSNQSQLASSTLLPSSAAPRVTNYSVGQTKWSGSFNSGRSIWSITSTGLVPNPTGAASVSRVVQASVWVSTVVFTSTRDPGDGTTDREIWVMNADGSAPFPLTNNTSEDGDANWSPDTASVVFETERDSNACNLDSTRCPGVNTGHSDALGPLTTNREVYQMKADGSGPTNLTNYDGHKRSSAEMLAQTGASTADTVCTNKSIDEDPQFGPLGRIVWDTYRDCNWNVYIMNGDGSGQSCLTCSMKYSSGPFPGQGSDDQEPAYSNPGPYTGSQGKVCFQSDLNADGSDGTDLEIWTMNPDGSGRQALTNNLVDDRECDWSPDGQWLLFDSTQNGNRDLFIMKADGTSRKQLTTWVGDDANASWTPDGRIMWDASRTSGASNSNNPDAGDEMFIMQNPFASTTDTPANITQITTTAAGVSSLFPDFRDKFAAYGFQG